MCTWQEFKKSFLKEFTWKDLGFRWRHDDDNGDEKKLFFFFRYSEGCACSATALKVILLIWRIATAAYMITVTILYDAHTAKTNPNYPIRHWYFTNWGNFTTTIYYGLAALLSILAACDGWNGKNKLCEFIGWITWLFHACALQTETIITVVYWLVLVFTCARSEECYDVSFYNIHLHGGILVLLLVDYWISSLPTRLLHAVYGIIFGIIYTIVSGISHGVYDIPPVYEQADWKKNPGTVAAIMIFIAIFGPIIAQFMWFILHLRRKVCVKKCCASHDFMERTGKTDEESERGEQTVEEGERESAS